MGTATETLSSCRGRGLRGSATAVSPWTDHGTKREAFREYQLYGVSVHSQISLSFPEQGSNSVADVTLFLASAQWFAEVASEVQDMPVSDDWSQHFHCPDGSDFLRWPDLFEFLVSSDGRSVACRKLERATLESFQTYLLGQVLSFALVKQGYEPLHATAVVVKGNAVAFLGDCGHGKSTLAAAFLHAGHQVLTDDLLLIRDIGGICHGFSGPPRIKLFPEVARRFLPRQADATPMNPGCEKLIVPLEPHQVHSGPIPIHSFLVLGETEPGDSGLSLTTLAGTKPFIELIRSTFNFRLLDPSRLQQQFLHARSLLSRIPVKRLTYPREMDLLPQVCRAILEDTGAEIREKS